MRNLLFTFLMLFGVLTLSAQNWVAVTGSSQTKAQTNLISSDLQSSEINFSLDGFYLFDVQTPKGTEQVVRLKGASTILQKGSPDLVKMTASVIVPADQEMEVEVISAQYKDFDNISIAPSKGNFTRDINPADVAYTYGDAYATDAFFPQQAAEMRTPYVLRDFRGQTVVFYPFRYNAVTKTLRVYYDVNLRIKAVGSSNINTMASNTAPDVISADFAQVYQRQFINYNSASRYTPLEEDGNMLIICYDDFMSAMNPFVEWKTISGMTVEMVNSSQFSSANDIKSFVTDYYNDNGLTYLLIVGDAPQVPTMNTSAGHSDQAYGYIEGSDSYAEVFVGRFSAEDISDVEIQVTKAVEYEKEPNTNGTWMEHNVGIASDQGPGDDNEYDYQHIRNIQNDLLGYTWETSAELFDGSQGGLDAAGSPSPGDVANEINAGTSIINYTGHGSTTSWGSSGFSNSDINSLTNDDMLPYIFSVACVNGNFVNSTCFAEAWLRAENNGEPTGAVATIMSTINQSWDPPMHGQDAMVDILVESFTDNIKRTFGGVTVNGCFEMNDEYGSGGDEMTDTWTIFGDPSLMLRTKMPANLNATYEPIIPINATTYSVSTNAGDGRAALSYNGELLGVGYLQNGNATITLNQPLTSTMLELDLVILPFNFEPLITTIQITAEPGQVLQPVPASGKLGVYPFANLSWEAGIGGEPTAYKVFVGTDNPPTNLVNGDEVNTPEYIFANELAYETEYFWRIDAVNDFGTSEGEVWSFIVAEPPGEDFETGNFLANAWVMEGDADWVIDDVTVFHEGFSARSGAIGDDQVSSLKIEMEVEGFMSHIKFFQRVSTDGSDKLRFYIDGSLKGEWGGLSQWSEEIFNVTSGHHVFEWKYEKGSANAGGDDAVWVDFIYFPTTSVMSANAGQDMNICEGSSCELHASGAGYTSALWTTNGDGSFDDPTIPEAVYTPGSQDIANGAVILTFEVTDGEDSAEDNMTLTIQPAPVAFAGGTAEICAGEEITIQSSNADNHQSVLWTTSGDGAFGDPTRLHAIYTPGFEDATNGSVELTLTVVGIEPCAEASDVITLTVNSAPLAPEKPAGPEAVAVNQIGQSVYTVAEVEGATAYLVSLSDETAGTVNMEANVATVSWNIDFFGEIEITAQAINECGESELSEALLVTLDNNVGIGEQENDKFEIYPNPTSGNVNLVCPAGYQLEVRNLLGELVYNVNETSEGKTQLDMSRFPNGIYYIVRISEEGKDIKKLILNK